MNSDLKCKTFIFKIASRCNLNCSYCYMYNKGDVSYKGLPKLMSERVVQASLTSIRAHCDIHQIGEVLIAFHGGEPMLAGIPYFKRFIHLAHTILGSHVKIYFAIQTNGTLITEQWCKFFSDNNIKVGISLDGIREENDRYRLDHRGRGSYDKTLEGYRTCLHNGNSPGILSVINIESDPLVSYHHFKSLQASYIDYLLPYNTYDDPPVGLQVSRNSGHRIQTPYADWLIAIFDQWFYDKEPKPDIRFFSGIIYSILGFEFPVDLLGEFHNELMVIETDGGIEAVDALKICGHEFTKANLNVLTHDFEIALQSDLAYVYHMSHSLLCAKCAGCPVKDICGGGYLPHRYKKANGFNNPSLYCEDLLKLITHIQTRVRMELPEVIVDAGQLAGISFNEALDTITQNLLLAEEPPYSFMLSQFANDELKYEATNIKV